MKRIIYLLLLFPFICFGQVPQSMSYQAMATNSEGFEIANSQISVKVSIIEETPLDWFPLWRSILLRQMPCDVLY